MNKPLGRKAYGSIAHLPSSRIGPGDHHCHAGQERICTEKARDKHDRIIVTEKLDGSNTAIANIDGSIVALGRSGYRASTSPYEQHHLFAYWVQSMHAVFVDILATGDVLHGEWLAQAHGTIYKLEHMPFVAFDLSTNGIRNPWDTVVERCGRFGVPVASVLHDGGPVSLEKIKQEIEVSRHGVVPPDTVEGAVWRVERKGAFDFMAKWVRPDKVDGKYLESVSGKPTIWNWLPPQRITA